MLAPRADAAAAAPTARTLLLAPRAGVARPAAAEDFEWVHALGGGGGAAAGAAGGGGAAASEPAPAAVAPFSVAGVAALRAQARVRARVRFRVKARVRARARARVRVRVRV